MKNLKKILTLLTLVASFSAMALLGFGDNNASKNKNKVAKDCEVPAFAKAIGHKDQWLLHNGCPPEKKTNKDKGAESKDAK